MYVIQDSDVHIHLERLKGLKLDQAAMHS